MSYSFNEVLPYLVHKEYGTLNFHYDFFKNIIQKKEDLDELQELCNKLISAEGEYYSTFKIPAFTRGDKTFSAKTFNITVNHIDDKVLDDCYEGKTFYHYSSYLTDSDSNQRMVLISHYYAAIDRDLTNIEIYLPHYEDDTEDNADNSDAANEKVSYSFVLIKGEKSDFEILGVFSSLEKATDAIDILKKEGVVKKPKDLHIEKIICDSVLLPNKSHTINVLKDCLESYSYKGTTLYSLS